MASLSRSIRRNALAKIAELSATSSTGEFDGSDLERLCRVSPGHKKLSGRMNGVNNDFSGSLAGSPMNIREFEVLLALCKAGPLIDNTYSAEKTHQLISEKLWIYLDNCVNASETATENRGVSSEYATEIEEAIHVATVTMSLLGFLDAVASLANFWSARERLNLCDRVKTILSEGFLVAIETAFSTIRNTHLQSSHVKEWKRYVRHYAAIGRPLGAMLLQRSFMWLLVAGSSLMLVDANSLRGHDILSILMSRLEASRPNSPRSEQDDSDTVNTLADIATKEISLLEDSADYLRLGSAWQQKLAFSVKASAITTYLNCAMLNVSDDEVEPETLMSWLEDTLADPVQMADETLANVVLRSMALVSKLAPQLAPEVSRLLPRFIVQGNPQGNIIVVASACLAYVLHNLSQDAVITTLYTLGNVLSSGASHPDRTPGPNGDLALDGAAQSNLYGKNSNGSSISLEIFTEEDTAAVYGNVVQAICAIAQKCEDAKIIALAQSMLLQKIDKISQHVDSRIITAAAELSLSGGPLEFRSLLKLYGKITHMGVIKNNEAILYAIMKGRNFLSSHLQKDSPLYEIYLENLLEDIISRGDVHQGQNTREADVEAAAKEIAQLLQPLAVFFSTNNMGSNNSLSDEVLSLVYLKELRVLALHSKPLVAEQRGEQVESDIELNTVLRRGISQEHEATQKRRLTALLPSRAREIGGLSYRKVIFLQAAYLVETLRADAGDCSKALTYFLEPSMRRGEMSSTMEAVTAAVMDTYLRKTLTGLNPTFSAPYVAKQLASIFTGCCYRIERVQQAAMNCADRIIRDVPSALCQKSSLFALLELLSLLWASCLEAETDEYGLRSSFTSVKGEISIELSDDYGLRRRTLNALYKKAKYWEYDDEGVYGHISLGRSFASEMGSVIPSMDQRLEAIDRHGECNINTASDFIAQYTTRQEYRYAEALPDHNTQWLRFMHLDEHRASITSKSDKECDDAVTLLAKLEAQIHKKKHIPIGEFRDILRRAAALLCRSDKDDHQDPFYIKEEFAPSDRTVLAKKQQAAHNMLAPHMRLLQFLSSHFNATRLALKRSTGHPLAREIRFQIVLFGLRVLRHTTTLDFPSKCRLKDKILSAALSWFTFAPRTAYFIANCMERKPIFGYTTSFQIPSVRLHHDIRSLLLQFPDKAISEPEAVHILLGDSLPSDVAFQMKYLLYWSPVNPISAVTYFLPSYRNHPFIVQYAMRALESHSVDVTFFYVPQIVQTLRYDDLGYVERYIVETAKFSQLFAHQIIWNMKANAFKDEDSQILVSIDSPGKPLQSHAKAPYMATFRIKKSIGDNLEGTDDMLEETNKNGSTPSDNSIEIWQSAIFKVGDDCRQDVLALQMIAAFRGIFNNVGLDVYVFPYRVTATAPGCGVIDVLPNSISRDMLGREAVNGLYDYFISKYGNEDSLRFQEARANFVKSMAAYSIISFLLQFKDRHNGNIMIDDAGHILHIDFGFCFDIAPGGVKFERAPFKLTTEMVAVMGGSTEHQAFKWFEELCVKAFLASRPYTEKLSQLVMLMMDSGLPCFKPESIQHFRERFVLEKTEAGAADFMRNLIKKSYGSYSTGVYDQFQLLTNGIPY
ncbi:hypothetical protein DID88_004165 [Monilinia fructigena]|uniref:1-phosphatidylinositol 4-kinase n=1 Tax=Monilinia fructigena TaxID=38457 RepID=A0A395IRZ3_9HELO|nr:hypothetical protein DID88_004165 [Monilinia fructigena]